MAKLSTCMMLILTFLQTGRSNNRIFTSQRWEHATLTLTCDLSGEDNVSQINWETVTDSNQTILGILHNSFEPYIAQKHARIDGHSLLRSTSLVLTEVDVSNGTRYCCVFITFPSGTMQDCIQVTDTMAIAGAQEQVFEVRAETLLLAVFIIPLIILMVTVYCSWRHFCSRRRVFEVQQSELADLQTDDEESTEGTSLSTPKTEEAQSLDSSQLYSKINRYYERLWKACQATGWAWPPVVHPGVYRIYYLLGEHKQPQKEQEDLLQP